MTHKKLKSLHGLSAYTTDREVLVGRGAVGTGGIGKPSIVMPGSPDITAIWEDFHGNTAGGVGVTHEDTGTLVVNDTGAAGPNFIVKIGGDTGPRPSYVAGAANGIFRMTGPDSKPTAATPASSGIALTGKVLGWQAQQGKGKDGALRMVARIRGGQLPLDTGGDGGRQGMFIGFTDTLSYEFPVYDTGGGSDTGTWTSNAADAVGIWWGSQGDTGFVGLGVRGDTVQNVPLNEAHPIVNKWYTLEMEISSGTSDTGGLATFWIDGVPLGQIVSPVTSATALVPVIYFFDTGGGATATLDVDYVNVAAPRDTGD